jgi:hypothetical protein
VSPLDDRQTGRRSARSAKHGASAGSAETSTSNSWDEWKTCSHRRAPSLSGRQITSDANVAAPTHERVTGPPENRAGRDPAHRRHSWAERGFLSHPAPTRPSRLTHRRRWRIERKSRQRRPLAVALLFSLLIHALLLSLRFGGEEFGLPGLAFPWRDRRIEVPDLRVVLVPARVAPAEPTVMSAAPSQRVSVDPPRAGAPVLALRMVETPDWQGTSRTNAGATKPSVQADATQGGVAPAASMEAPVRAQGPDRPLPAQVPEPTAINAKPSDDIGSVARA